MKVKIIKLPKIEGAKSEDYLCVIAADNKTLSFCGYPFSGIFILDLNNPEKFSFIELSLDKKDETFARSKKGIIKDYYDY